MGGDGRSSSGERGAWEAASLVFRIATVGLSLASAIMTATSTQCVRLDDGGAAGTVSSSDYGSFKYSALAELLSAALQGVAIFLEVAGKEKWASAVELIDKLVLALTSTSAPLLFAADDITSCGGPRRRGGGSRRDARGQPRALDDKLRLAAYVSLGPLALTTANEVMKKLRRHKKVAVESPSGGNSPGTSTGTGTTTPPPPPFSCSCPTVTTPCCCENHDPCSASTF